MTDIPIVDLSVHHAPRDARDHIALAFTKLLRWSADTFFAKRYGHRAIVLETVAAVPGMVGATLNHLKCLRRMEDDKGWIRTMKGHMEDVSGLTYKDGDKGEFTFHAMSTDKVMLFSSSGKFFTLDVGKLPGGRGHGEPVPELQARGILMDGSTANGEKRLLLQIFSQTLLGPVFFEFIQRKADEGFGEGNFKALFESLERDQIRRGAIEVDGV